MNADKAITIFRELTVGRSITCRISYFEPEKDSDFGNEYQISIPRPLKPGTKKDVEEIKQRYHVEEIREPVAYQTDGTIKGQLVWY